MKVFNSQTNSFVVINIVLLMFILAGVWGIYIGSEGLTSPHNVGLILFSSFFVLIGLFLMFEHSWYYELNDESLLIRNFLVPVLKRTFTYSMIKKIEFIDAISGRRAIISTLKGRKIYFLTRVKKNDLNEFIDILKSKKIPMDNDIDKFIESLK